MPKSQSKKSSSQRTKTTRKKPTQHESPKLAIRKELPGARIIAKQSFAILFLQDRLIVRLIALAWVVALLVFGLVYTAYYGDLSQSTDDVSGNLPGGVIKTGVEVMALTISLMSGAAGGQLTEGQQIFATLGYVLLWLVLVWLLRYVMNDTAVRIRDGIYSAAAPLISTLGLVVVALLQLVPLALLVSLFASISVSGVLTGVWWTLAFVVLTLLAAAGTLYWLVGTLIALVMVTIPGTYPMAALKSAKALVTGFRRHLVIAVAWLLAIVLIAQLVLLVPVILFDSVIGYKLPWLVASIYQLIVVASYVYAGIYVYVLYRRLIDARS